MEKLILLIKLELFSYIKYLFYFSLLFFICLSCTQNKTNRVNYKMDFPSKIKLGDTINGLVIYKSDFGKIDLKKTERRYVYLVLESTKYKSNLQNVIQRDTFGLIYDSIIPVYGIVLKELGKNNIAGQIIDEIFLETESPKVGLKKSTLKTKISFPVIVSSQTQSK